MKDCLQIHYEMMDDLAQRWTAQVDAATSMQTALVAALSDLEAGKWRGMGANSFFQTMHNTLLPTIQRLIGALEAGASTTLAVSTMLR